MSKMYRVFEAPCWFDAQGKAGEAFGDQQWTVGPKTNSYSVCNVSWDIMAESRKDLSRLLWGGHLHWSFSGTDIDIAPLTRFDGSFMDLFMGNKSDGLSDLEKLAAVQSGEQWLETFRAASSGPRLFHRGLFLYKQTPVVIPVGQRCWLCLKLDEPFELEADLRVRVNLHGKHQTHI